MKAGDLSLWQSFQLWVELDATQLGMDVATYYGLCAVCGAVQAVTFYRCIQGFMP